MLFPLLHILASDVPLLNQSVRTISSERQPPHNKHDARRVLDVFAIVNLCTMGYCNCLMQALIPVRNMHTKRALFL